MSQKTTRKYDLSKVEEEMVTIPKGKIELRDDRIKKKWTVELQPFLLSKFPVTQVLYHQITKEAPSAYKGDNRPVETVSWKDSVVFCNSLSKHVGLDPCYSISEDEITYNDSANGYRLPTEAEWEYACKAGTTEPRYGELESIAWYKGNSDRSTQDVGLKEPNAWGFMICSAMCGNGVLTSMIKRFMAHIGFLEVEDGPMMKEDVLLRIDAEVTQQHSKLMILDLELPGMGKTK